MGIKNLNKLLKTTNSVIDNEYNKEFLDQFGQVFCKNEREIQGFYCHIDTSLILHKFLFGCENMEEAYQSIKRCLIKLKKNKNRILLYMEPKNNKRKQETQEKRKNEQGKTRQNIKRNISKEIELFNNYKPDDNTEINTVLLEAIGYYDEEGIDKKETYEDYISKIDIINKEKDMYIENREKLDIFDHGFSVIDDETEEEMISKEVESQIRKSEYNILSYKQLFQYFLRQNSMNKHQRYIKTRLLEDGVITTKDLIETEYFDAEVNIIHNIKTKYLNKKNLIISVDQDCTLFYLLHLNTNYIYLKSNIGINIDDVTIVKNNILTKNVSILCALFNKTDYFLGIYKCGITEKRLEDYISENSIINTNLTIKEIISSYVLWFLKNKKTIPSKNKGKVYEPIVYEYVEKYFTDFELYLSLDPCFYENRLEFKQLEILDLHNYFININQMVPTLNETEDKIIYKEYSKLYDKCN